MSEKDQKNVRRFGRRDQKDKLTKPDSLFPADDESSERSEQVDFDINALNLPDTDSEALEMLSSLQDEVKAPVITPREERYPPVAPVDHRANRPSPVAETSAAKKEKGACLYNLLTILFLLATLVTIAWFVIVWINPLSPFNPLPPATPFVEVVVTSDSPIVPPPIDATPDDTGQIFVVITDTPVPTAIGTESPFPFIAESVLYAPNSNELACNWWSIAGTVTDLESNPLSGYRIRVTGDGLDETVFSGVSQAFGEGGYELPLVGTPREEMFTVQLFSPQDVPLSEEITVATRADCESNIAILNFIQNR